MGGFDPVVVHPVVVGSAGQAHVVRVEGGTLALGAVDDLVGVERGVGRVPAGDLGYVVGDRAAVPVTGDDLCDGRSAGGLLAAFLVADLSDPSATFERGSPWRKGDPLERFGWLHCAGCVRPWQSP